MSTNRPKVPRLLLLLFLITALIFAGCGGSSGSDFKYVAIGASDAVGIGASTPNQGYVFELADSLETELNKNVELINLGVPGVEADQIEDAQVTIASNLEPELITVWTGSNDVVAGRAVEEFEADLRDILSDLSDTGAVILIGNLPKLSELPKFQEEPDADVTPARVDAYNEVIARVAAEFGALVVNLNDLEPTDTLVSGDGFHPSEAGHKTIANRFLAVALTVFEPAPSE